MELYTKMDVKAVQNGIIRKVGGVKHFAIISSIAAFVDSNGRAFPSQDKIADMTGYSRKTINSTLKELRDTKIDGEPILKITQEKSANGRRNVYVLSPKCGFTFGKNGVTNTDNDVTNDDRGVVTPGLQEQEPRFNNIQLEQEPKEIVFDNAKSVVDYFRQKYYETYNTQYSTNWKREPAMIKNKLLSTFTDSEIKAMVDTVFAEYERQWANVKFPRPTIGQLTTWLGNKALAMSQEKAKASEQVEADSKKYDYDDDHFEKLLNEI